MESPLPWWLVPTVGTAIALALIFILWNLKRMLVWSLTLLGLLLAALILLAGLFAGPLGLDILLTGAG